MTQNRSKFTNNYFTYPIITGVKYNAKSLNANLTRVEKRLWFEYLASQTAYKWRKQKLVGAFVLDFFCHELALSIELDGISHQKTASYDLNRTKFLESMQIKVLRFSNYEVLYNLNQVIQTIEAQTNHLSQL
jgi:very-short-patch-repair endonuclease